MNGNKLEIIEDENSVGEIKMDVGGFTVDLNDMFRAESGEYNEYNEHRHDYVYEPYYEETDHDNGLLFATYFLLIFTTTIGICCVCCIGVIVISIAAVLFYKHLYPKNNYNEDESMI